VRAFNAGRVHGDQGRNAKMTLEIAALGLTHLVEGVKRFGSRQRRRASPAARRRRRHSEVGRSSGSAGSMGRLDDIDGVIGPHQRAGRFNEFHCTVVSLAATIARTVGT
jgi:hypothetical protein